MTAVVEVYDRHGQLLDVLTRIQFGTRTWCLDVAGDCVFQVPRGHLKASQLNLGALNLVIVKSDLGVPDWGGRIQLVTWADPEVLTVTCKSKETLLQRCVVDRMQTYSNWTAGAIVRDVVQRWGIDLPGNQDILRLGTIFPGGDTLGDDVDVTGDDIWDKTIPDLRALSGHDCWVDADGTFNWVAYRGQDLSSNVILRRGHHIVRATYVLDFGPIVTKALAFGSAETINQVYEDPAARGKWGSLAVTIDGTDDSAASLLALAQVEVARHKQPEEKLDLYVVNRAGVFGQFWIGDTIRVVIPEYGFREWGGVDMFLRVGGIELDEAKGAMRIVGAVDTLITAKKKHITPLTEPEPLQEGDQYETFPDDGGYDPGDYPGDDYLYDWGPDYIGISEDGGETYQDITPTTDPPNSCVDPINPTMAGVTIESVISVDGVLYATAIWRNPVGNWRSWMVTSNDRGQNWIWSPTLQPAGGGGVLDVPLYLLIGAGVALWTTYGSCYAYAGLGGEELRISDAFPAPSGAFDPSPTAITQDTNITLWGNVVERKVDAYGNPYLEEIQVRLEGAPLQFLSWGAGEIGFKQKSFDVGVGMNVWLNVFGDKAGFGRPFHETGGWETTVNHVGACFTVDIPAATSPCDGTQLAGLAGDFENDQVYGIGHSVVSVPPGLGISLFDPGTNTWGDWHVIMPNVSEAEFAAGTAWLNVTSPKSGSSGYGSTAYAYGTDGAGAVVYKSSDAGVTWTQTSTGLPAGAAVNALAVVSGQLSHNYAFCSDGKVYKQTAGAGAWGPGIDISMWLVPQTIDVGYDLHHTIIATGGGVTATAREPYTTWTILHAPGANQAVWIAPP